MKIAKAKKEAGEVELTWEDYKSMEFTHCVSSLHLSLSYHIV